MRLRSHSPIMRVEALSIPSEVDTQNVEDLFGLWSVFSKCAETMKEGKRLENLVWRAWGKESFCCASEPTQKQSIPRWQLERSTWDSPMMLPALSSSSSLDSASSAATGAPAYSQLIPARPELRRLDSEESHNRGREKHITPDELKDLVVSIQETKSLDSPLPPLPPALQMQPAHAQPDTTPAALSRCADTTPRPSSPPGLTMAPESSTSTVATQSSDYSEGLSPPPDSEASTSTELSSHSIIRGFSLGRISSSIRSSSNLAPTPTPILKNSPAVLMNTSRGEPAAKRKTATFTLGGSSGEGDESSLETRFGRESSLTASLKRPAGLKKNTSFKEEVSMRTIKDRGFESEEVFESDSEEEEQSESAIEDDDDIWEDEDEGSGPSSVNDRVSFQRVDSKPNLTSRRSLLTQAMHEPDRARALQNAASRSTPAIRRSRTSTPNGPSLATSPKQETAFQIPGSDNACSRPILMTTSNTTMHLPPMSPRTTRRNMLQSEMTESLRKQLLWERQQKNSTHNAHLKRRHTSMDVKNLQHYPRENLPNLSGRLPFLQEGKATSSWNNNHFDSGLLEYHEKGW